MTTTFADTDRDARWANIEATNATLIRDVRLHAMNERARNGGLADNEAWNIVDTISSETLHYIVDPDMDSNAAIFAVERWIRERM